MGEFIWHHWARVVSIFASVYLVWAGMWGIAYRKFFWDFVGGHLDTVNAPPIGGFHPGPNSAPFLEIIVKVPLIQILSILFGLFTLLLEYPAPFMKQTSLYRSFAARAVLLVLQSFVAVFFYQGTNAAIYGTIAAFAYGRAAMRGEMMEEAKENRGKASAA